MEHSGFFDAVWDEDLLNPDTGEMGDYDLRYLAEEFANYFKLFIGNGVFGNPTNQLLVTMADTGNAMQVSISEGWAFINGYWYYNDNPKTMTVPINSSTDNRVDSIMIRYSNVDRKTQAVYVVGSIDPVRDGNFYDLKAAEIIVPVASVGITQANITDTRPNEDVCGFVTGLLAVQATKDLFAQYQAIFDEWFADLQETLSGDVAYQLSERIDALTLTVGELDDLETEEKGSIVGAINEVYNIAKEVEKTFLLKNMETLNFTGKQCIISDSRITAASLADVYFTSDTISEAERANISVETAKGAVALNALKTPEATIKASILIRVV